MRRPSLDEHQLNELAAALKTLPVDSARAWRDVRRRLPGAAVRPAPRRQSLSAALSVSVLTAFLALTQLGVAGALARPAFAAGTIPVPRSLAVTPATGSAALSLKSATDIPPHPAASTPAPLPLRTP